MDFQKVADLLRSSTSPLAVSQIVILSNQGEFTGNGKLRSSEGSIELEVTLAGDRELPMEGGTLAREQFWKIGGIIESQVPFWGVSVPNQSNIRRERFTLRGCRFSFDRIHHLTASFGDGKLRDALVEAVEIPKEESPAPVRGCVTARLTDYKIVGCDLMTVKVEKNPFLGESSQSERNTLKGELGNFEYGIIQRESDCVIHLRLKKDASAPAGEIARVSQALYRALAFVHGRHCWPQWERIETGSGSVLEYATAPRAVSENIHTPITQTTCSNGSEATLLIAKAVECFIREDDFSEALDNYLFLAREASAKDTPTHVGTLGLCAVFEGFVGFLHKYLCTETNLSGAAEFKHVQYRLVNLATKRADNTSLSPDAAQAWKRFVKILQNADHTLRPPVKYCQVVERLRLSPEKMSQALDAWQKHRHPLAHGASPKDDLREQMFATSRIAGAINVLAAAPLGYSGLMVLSRIEDQYIRLP